MARPMASPIPRTASVPVPDTSARNIVRSYLDVDLDDGLHPEEATHHEEEATAEHDATDRLVEQGLHVIRVDHEHRDTQCEREDGEHVGADAAFRRERLHVPAETLALRHRL